jgi:hypothetical protein
VRHILEGSGYIGHLVWRLQVQQCIGLNPLVTVIPPMNAEQSLSDSSRDKPAVMYVFVKKVWASR